MTHADPTEHLGEFADILERVLREKMLPYWHKTCDPVNGGYILADRQRTWLTRLRERAHINRASPFVDKLIVSQARLVYVFSLAHRLGYGNAQLDYLSAAEMGYRFLIDRMFDRRQRVFHWSVDQQGTLLDAHKFLYGQAMAIYGLVEYHRASGSAEPLEYARRVFDTVNRRMRDPKHSGWLEHFDADLQPLEPTDRESSSSVDVVGLKSGDAHLHWMEALTELYAATADPIVRGCLAETLKINREIFFPPDVARGSQFCAFDWEPVAVTRFDKVSYGHQVEFAWLMIRAQQALGISPAWDHFHALVQNSLAFGFDHARGGFFDRGMVNQPARITEKFWWVQAEGLAALSDAMCNRPDMAYQRALALLLNWILKYQMVEDGVWIWSADATGKPANRTKAARWKAGYHEVRAITKFVKAFSRLGKYQPLD